MLKYQRVITLHAGLLPAHPPAQLPAPPAPGLPAARPGAEVAPREMPCLAMGP